MRLNILLLSILIAKYYLVSMASAAPAAPENFLVSLADVDSTSVTVNWTDATSDYTYRVYYISEDEVLTSQDVTTDISGDVSTDITDLKADERYVFYSTILSDESTDNESLPSKDYVVDLEDNSYPPNSQIGLQATITGKGQIDVSFRNNNETMVDYSGNRVYYGTVAGNPHTMIDIGSNTEVVISGLTGAAYYVSVAAYDVARPNSLESKKSPEVLVTFHVNEQASNVEDDLQGGCFISTAESGIYDHHTSILRVIGLVILTSVIIVCWCLVRFDLLTIIGRFLSFGWVVKHSNCSHVGTREADKKERTNKTRISRFVLLIFTACLCVNPIDLFAIGYDVLGLKLGYFQSQDYKTNFPLDFSDSESELSINDNTILDIYYARFINSSLYLDVAVGLTGIENKDSQEEISLTVMPASVSLVQSLLTISGMDLGVGGGLDFWMLTGSVNDEDYDEYIAGYHLKTNLRYYFFIAELEYSWIDRFSKNTSNVGGLKFSVGLFYQFYIF